MRLLIAWSPLYPARIQKGWSSDPMAVRSAIRSGPMAVRWPIAGAMNAENLFGQFSERSGRQSPIGGQLQQWAWSRCSLSRINTPAVHHDGGRFGEVVRQRFGIYSIWSKVQKPPEHSPAADPRPMKRSRSSPVVLARGRPVGMPPRQLSVNEALL